MASTLLNTVYKVSPGPGYFSNSSLSIKPGALPPRYSQLPSFSSTCCPHPLTYCRFATQRTLFSSPCLAHSYLCPGYRSLPVGYSSWSFRWERHLSFCFKAWYFQCHNSSKNAASLLPCDLLTPTRQEFCLSLILVSLWLAQCLVQISGQWTLFRWANIV